MTRIQLAQQMAHEAHDSIKQVRKYTGEPYWVHTDEVAFIVHHAIGYVHFDNHSGPKEDMICAAHLHDVIEDVMPINPKYDLFLIGNTFGKGVADLVAALTDVYTKEAWPDLNRERRKNLERERIGKTSQLAKTIKLADLISNTQSIVQHDKDFARVYLKEKLALLPYLADGSPELLDRASKQVIQSYASLGLTMPVFSAKV